MDIKFLKTDEINIGINTCISKYISNTYFSQTCLFEIRLHSVSGIDVSETFSSLTKLYLSCIL